MLVDTKKLWGRYFGHRIQYLTWRTSPCRVSRLAYVREVKIDLSFHLV